MIRGIVGIRIVGDSQDWASLKLFVNEATTIISADASSASGATDAMMRKTVIGPKSTVMPSSASGTKRMARANAQVARMRVRMQNRAVAASLPRAKWSRATGSVSKGSREPRSRSPAVVSMAR